MSERKEMSTEMRSLLAAVLCLIVIAGWSLIYKPPQQPQTPRATASRLSSRPPERLPLLFPPREKPRLLPLL